MTYYKKLNNEIQCLLCPNYCILQNNEIGLCNVNKNENQELVNLVYNKPATLNISPIEKHNLYHFFPESEVLSIETQGDNLKTETSKIQKIDSEIGELTPYDMMNIVAKYRCNGVVYTQEPAVFYPYAKDIGELVSLKGAKNIFVTNGYLSHELLEDMEWIDAMSIELKTFSSEFYNKIGGNLDNVLDIIKLSYQKGIWIEIKTSIINFDENDIFKIAKFISSISVNIPWHINITQSFTLQKIYNIAKSCGLRYVYFSGLNVANITKCPECGESLVIRHNDKIQTNNLTKDGLCPKCNTQISGVWAKKNKNLL